MAGSAAINLAARILRQVADGAPADRALRDALPRTRHRSAPGERREVSRAVFTYFRWARWLPAADSPQKQLAEALAWQERFDRNPAACKPQTLAARAVPDWVTDEIPWPEFAAAVSPAARNVVGADARSDRRAVGVNRSHPATAETNPVGADAPSGSFGTGSAQRPYPTELAWLRQLQREPALWIRAKSGLVGRIASELGHCAAPVFAGAGAAAVPLPSAVPALRYAGTHDLFWSDGFQRGDFEIQDLASQLVGLACAPRPGETWWDACAGEGGKTLHLADQMRNQGLIWASDRSARRLAKLKERAARAKMFNYRTAPWAGGARLPTRAKFDGILVDAPCSGVGTWQRNPHARWTTQPQDVRELAAVQARLLDQVAGSLKAGGRLLYAVCTLTRAETTEVARAFSTSHADLAPTAVWPADRGSSGRERAGLPDSPGSGFSPPTSVFLWPQDLNANGMFLAAWRKK